ncbi:unnamed protein product [Brassica rapa]|uniref:Proteasome alpha-type subunits domain-containing protein n=1 Tax=Brassica campestris TaxID=3711 RepID=A0A8D9HSE8_BRACM|nr:unnamed protein product [Brassica rapa]
MESDHVMMMRTTATFRTRSCDDCVRVRASLRRELLCANSFYKKSKAVNFHYFLRLSLPSSLFDPYIEGFFEVSLRCAMGDSQYSFSLTTFSPSGKLVQIEHALTAVGSGQTSLGIKASNGVVIATEKKLPSILVDEASVQKIQHLTPNIGVVYSGMGPDFRVLVRKSRKQAEQYNRLYKEPIPVTQLVRETATVMQEFTQSGGVRPFGVSLLVAGYDDKGPQLYQVDPSGSYFSWKASAMGKNVSNAKTFLEKRYTEDMELDDAIHTAILTLKEGFEGEISSKNIEIGKIGADKVFRVLTPAEIDDYLAEVE